MKSKIKLDGITCYCNEDAIIIKYSHLIDCKDAKQFCRKLKQITEGYYVRSASSWTAELVAHNILYHANLFHVHVVDTDLEENEKLHRRIAYRIIYWGYLITSVFQRRFN